MAESTLRTRFDAPLDTVARTLGEKLAGRSVDAPPSQWWATAIEASQRRFAAAYDLESFSIRKAAEALALHLEVLALKAGQISTEDSGDVSGALLFLWTLRTLAWPVTPDLPRAVALAFGSGARPRRRPAAPGRRRTARRSLPHARRVNRPRLRALYSPRFPSLHQN
ncbi:hypothetical protein GCM10020221_12830 [Streptomyces thioluteus]|uniref:Uncharacterized protein n=1 Tax=Streptomyces thioluteus TaxID=66431 RepID=A0ABP6J241_STRTU